LKKAISSVHSSSNSDRKIPMALKVWKQKIWPQVRRRRITSEKKMQQISSIKICVQKNSWIPTKKLPLLNIKQEDFLRWQIFFLYKKKILRYLIISHITKILRELTIKNGFAINHQLYCICNYTVV
jgi:hypothetical protein